MKKEEKISIKYFIKRKFVRDINDEVVARIKGRFIYSSDNLFLDCVKAGGKVDETIPRYKYTIYDERTNQLVGFCSSNFDVYNTSNEYFGTIHSQVSISKTIIICIILALATLFLVFSCIPSTGNDRFTKNIVVSEQDGGVVTTDWNVFGKIEPDKVIYPGKTGEYYFSLENVNNKSIICTLNFAETNEHGIPMDYRLLLNEEYLKGSEIEFTPIEDMSNVVLTIPKKSSVLLRLDWRWQELSDRHAQDTLLGTIANANYIISITVTTSTDTNK